MNMNYSTTLHKFTKSTKVGIMSAFINISNLKSNYYYGHKDKINHQNNNINKFSLKMFNDRLNIGFP